MPKLLIGTYFKRPKAPIQLPNGDGTFTTYFFQPVDPANPDSEHVAIVMNAQHQQRLLAIAEGYYISEAQLAVDVAKAAAASMSRPQAMTAPFPTPAPAATTADTPPPAPEPAPEPNTAPPAETGGDSQSDSAPATTDTTAADELLALSLAAFKKAVAEAPQAVLRAALDIETARGVDERPTFTKALRAAIRD